MGTSADSLPSGIAPALARTRARTVAAASIASAAVAAEEGPIRSISSVSAFSSSTGE